MLRPKHLLSCLLLCWAANALAAGDYRGDERCPLPREWTGYSLPYNPLDHPNDFPTFPGAELPGWSCSYNRGDGVIVTYGDSRSPQQQWMDTYGKPDQSD